MTFDLTTARENILDLPIPHNSPYTLAKPKNLQLYEILKKIQREGKLPYCINTLQSIELTLQEYKNDGLGYKIFQCVPSELVKKIEQKLKLDESTKAFIEYLYISWKLGLSKNIYTCTIIFTIFCGFFCVVSVVSASNGFYWLIPATLILLVLLCLWIFLIQVPIFDDTVRAIRFTKIYEEIYNVIENIHKEHLNLIADFLSIPTRIETLEQDSEFNKVRDRIKSDEQENYERLELERRKGSQELLATLALAQATGERDVQIILDETELDRLAKELHIKNLKAEKECVHEITMSVVENMGRAVVEQSKILAKDDEEQRNIQYQLDMLNGIKDKIQKSGYAAMSDMSVVDSMKKMMEMAMNPKKTKP